MKMEVPLSGLLGSKFTNQCFCVNGATRLPTPCDISKGERVRDIILIWLYTA